MSYTGFPGGAVVKNVPASAGAVRDMDLILGGGRSPGVGNGNPLQYFWASLMDQLVNNLPAMQETWVQSLDWEDPLEKGKPPHSSILVWRISWTL